MISTQVLPLGQHSRLPPKRHKKLAAERERVGHQQRPRGLTGKLRGSLVTQDLRRLHEHSKSIVSFCAGAAHRGTRVRVYYTNVGDQRVIDHVVVLDWLCADWENVQKPHAFLSRAALWPESAILISQTFRLPVRGRALNVKR